MVKFASVVMISVVIALAAIYFYVQGRDIGEETLLNLPSTIPIDIDDPTALEQNGQPLINDDQPKGNQTLRSKQQIPQRTESNLQGSSSTQQTVAPESFPDFDTSF